MKQKEIHEKILLSNQDQYILDALPDSVIACDREGKIFRINAAAMELFEVPSTDLYRGIFYNQFLHRYEIDDEQLQTLSIEPWLMKLVIDRETVSSPQGKIIVLQIPSKNKVYVNLCCLPLNDAQKCFIGTIYIFHDITNRYKKALHLQRVHQAALTLTEAIAHLNM